MFGSLNPTQWKIITADGLVKKGQGTLTGLLCASSSSMKISIYDGQDADGTLGTTRLLVDQLTLTAGNPYPIPAKLNNGLYIDVVSGTGSFTIFYD